MKKKIWPWGWRVVGFVVIFGALQVSWQGARGGVVERLVIHQATVRPAASLINAMTPQVQARAEGAAVKAVGGGINIKNGCEGLEALFLLLAAFAIAPLSWRMRAIGSLSGAALIYAANQARILGLFYAYRADPALFDLMHSTVTPIAMVLLVAWYFYAWLARASRSSAAS